MKTNDKQTHPETDHNTLILSEERSPANPASRVQEGTVPSCIAICSAGELFGGVERHILGILSGLNACGIDALLILFHDGELAAQAREQGFEPIILPSLNRSMLNTASKLARIFKQRKIRIVHVHGYKATVFCALARCWYPFAMVKTEHGLPEPMAGRTIPTLRNNSYHFSDQIATRLTRTTVCYVSNDLLANYRRAHSGLKTTVIPNGIGQIDRYQLHCPAELREDWFNFAIVGRLDTVKGHHLAIEAIATDHLSPDSHLHIIGTGPCELKLRELAKSFGVANRVHFLGFRRNVYDYIAYCHVLLMPSLHEGLPYTLLEAMALGTPIIASDVGGLAEVLQNDKTALLFPSGNAAALARAITRLRDPTLRRRLGESAQHLQESQYSLKAMTARYVTIYQDALSAIDCARK